MTSLAKYHDQPRENMPDMLETSQTIRHCACTTCHYIAIGDNARCEACRLAGCGAPRVAEPRAAELWTATHAGRVWAVDATLLLQTPDAPR
jgi:hypothetical protein